VFEERESDFAATGNPFKYNIELNFRLDV
jgi:hypothetical protein